MTEAVSFRQQSYHLRRLAEVATAFMAGTIHGVATILPLRTV